MCCPLHKLFLSKVEQAVLLSLEDSFRLSLLLADTSAFQLSKDSFFLQPEMSRFGMFVFFLLLSVLHSISSEETSNELGDVKRLTLGEYFARTEAEVADLLKNRSLTRVEDGLSGCYSKAQQKQLNIFNASLPVAELLYFYYNVSTSIFLCHFYF